MLMAWWIALATAFVATPVLATVALHANWVDRREGLEDRKPRTDPVPTVGGFALLIAIAVACVWAGPLWTWPALLAAFSLGLLDDSLPGGLTPLQKLTGQLVVASLLAAAAPLGDHSSWVAGLTAMVAMNAVNTFDNADGAAGGLGLVGLAPTAAGAACLGFLPWNLARRPGRSAPFAYLGDSGSHLLGVLIASTPGALWVLLLPLLDLARLAPLRLRAGSKPWVGDRRHLAHRLEAAGWGPIPIAIGLALLAAPPVWGLALAGSWGVIVGAGLTVGGFTVIVRATSDPCPAGGRSR